MNPLIDKFEELYGEKPEPKEETVEETTKESEDEFVIPTAQVTPTGINLTGGCIMPGALISNTTSSYTTLSGYKRGFEIPNQTPVEQQFCKVMQNVADGKATVSSISADIDTAFTGFGGQIRYTVEIVGKYP